MTACPHPTSHSALLALVVFTALAAPSAAGENQLIRPTGKSASQAPSRVGVFCPLKSEAEHDKAVKGETCPKTNGTDQAGEKVKLKPIRLELNA